MNQKYENQESMWLVENMREYSSQPFVISSPRGHILFHNHAFCELTGYSSAEVSDMTWAVDFTPPEWHKRDTQVIEELLLAGTPQRYEKECIHKDGTRIAIELCIHRVTDTEGNACVYSFINNITELKKTKELLAKKTRELEGWLREFHCLHTLSKYVSKSTKSIEEVLQEIAGIIPSAFEFPETICARITLDGRAFKSLHFKETLWKQVSDITVSGKQRGLVEVYYMGENSRSYEEPFLEPEKNLVAFVSERIGYLFEHQCAKKLLRESEVNYRGIFNSVSDGIFVRDMDAGKLVDVNKRLCEMFGYTPEEFQSIKMEDLRADTQPFTNEERDRQLSMMVAEGGKTHLFESLVKDKIGREFWVEVSLKYTSIYDKNYLLAVIRDIDIRKQAEERLFNYQEQLRNLASELSLAEEDIRQRIATEMHDRIGQSLSLSKMKLAMLRKLALTDKLAASLQEVYILISQTLKDTRSLIIELRPPALYELGFEKAVEGFVKELQEKNGIQIEFKDDGQTKDLSDDIRVFLYNAVRELLINVIKHAQARHAKLSIKREGATLHTIVKDDGVGFDISTIDSCSYSDNCYGLFNIRERLSFLGGHLTLESEPHHGSCVTLVVPLKGFENVQGGR
jgi:PAS domain S-box-containing protein